MSADAWVFITVFAGCMFLIGLANWLWELITHKGGPDP